MRARAALRRFSGLTLIFRGYGLHFRGRGLYRRGRCCRVPPNRSLHNTQTGHRPESERLVDALDKLRRAVLHFERLRRIDLQVKHRGRCLSGRVGFWGGFCQFCRARIPSERRAGDRWPLANKLSQHGSAPAQCLACDRRHKTTDRDRTSVCARWFRRTVALALIVEDRHSLADG